MKKKLDEMKKELEHLYESVEHSIDTMYDVVLEIIPKNKDTREIIKNAKKALENIEISARCSYLTNHPETLQLIDYELYRMLSNIFRYLELNMNMSAYDIVEKLEKIKKERNRKEKN